ncbi:unnamed protein product [Rangifer tarandus platyrhynchus]|uniref:Uncharacterized protein n=1 Tax=Rangifer tarandus platyrhynchus TaxID=3082113 RepID=A0ABN8XYJ0_RANTA|nr:unnamed protein product [Rangifer tarandus platyrhynchus]
MEASAGDDRDLRGPPPQRCRRGPKGQVLLIWARQLQQRLQRRCAKPGRSGESRRRGCGGRVDSAGEMPLPPLSRMNGCLWPPRRLSAPSRSCLEGFLFGIMGQGT